MTNSQGKASVFHQATDPWVVHNLDADVIVRGLYKFYAEAENYEPYPPEPDFGASFHVKGAKVESLIIETYLVKDTADDPTITISDPVSLLEDVIEEYIKKTLKKPIKNLIDRFTEDIPKLKQWYQLPISFILTNCHVREIKMTAEFKAFISPEHDDWELNIATVIEDEQGGTLGHMLHLADTNALKTLRELYKEMLAELGDKIADKASDMYEVG